MPDHFGSVGVTEEAGHKIYLAEEVCRVMAIFVVEIDGYHALAEEVIS